jgi:hypothetical protein
VSFFDGPKKRLKTDHPPAAETTPIVRRDRVRFAQARQAVPHGGGLGTSSSL